MYTTTDAGTMREAAAARPIALRRQMFLFIAAPTFLIYVMILGLTTYYAYRESEQALQRDMAQLAASYAAQFDGRLREAAQIAETTARFMETIGELSDDKIYEQLERNVLQSSSVYGAAMAFEPGTIKPVDVLFSPYVHRSGDGVHRVNIDNSVYDWYRDPNYTWFSRPKALGHGVWSDPYFDKGAGNILMATFSAPFFLERGFGGVTTVDIDLPKLRETVGGGFDPRLDFVILTQDGQFVYDPNRSRIMAKTIFDVAAETRQPALASLARRMLEGTPGVGSIQGWDSSVRQWVFFAPIRSAKWVFAARIPETRVLADVRRRTIWNAVALGVTLVLIVTCLVVVSGRIAAPIVELKDKVLAVGQGNLGVRIDAASRTDEIRQLAASFNRMTSELRVQVQRLADEQSARHRIEHDLDIAREIQRGLLPIGRPELARYELAGWSQPADKTGGDYYDWQSLADGRTLVTLADVSGHGIGPALMTAVCRAYVRASFAGGQDFARTMDQLNELLVADLAHGRFVTLAAALLDPRHERIEVISAGHAPIFHYVTSRRKLTEYRANDLPLGIMPAVSYGPAIVLNFEPGDLLVFITDGFFEWPRADKQRFNLDRLRDAILAAADLPIENLIGDIYAKVLTFAAGTPQDDDVTAVIVRRMI